LDFVLEISDLNRHFRFEFEISDLKFADPVRECEIPIVLLKFGKSVDRRQYLATEATRPSRGSTVGNGSAEEKCGSFLRLFDKLELVVKLRQTEVCRTFGARETGACSSVG
jgi:hypothetical protein